MASTAPVDEARNRILRIGEHRLDVGALRLLPPGDPQRLTPKAIAVLLELAREPSVTQTREHLLARVWSERAPVDDVLTQAIRDLRRAFGDESSAPRYIETVPRVGYRLLAPVRWESGGVATTSSNDAPAAVGATNRRWTAHRLGVAFAALAVGLAAASVALVVRSPSATKGETSDYAVEGVLVLTADPGVESSPRVSPDGSRVAYLARDADTGRQRVQLRTSGGSPPIAPTSGSGDESWPVWSADGTELAFARRSGGRCALVTVPTLGGAERVRGDCGSGWSELFDWSPDGREFALATLNEGYGRGVRLSRHAVDGGDPLPFPYERASTDNDFAPHYSPDGRHIAFRRGSSPYSDICVVAVDGGPVRTLTSLASRMRGLDWLPDGRALVFASDHEGRSALYRVGLDDGIVRPLGVAPAQYPDVARNAGVVVYEIPRVRSLMLGARLDDVAATPTELAPSTGSDSHPSLSPDGTRIAFVSDRNGSLQLWLYDAAERLAFPLTHDERVVYLYPEWRADGRALVVTRRRNGRGTLVEIDASSHAQRPVSPPGVDVRFGTYGVDGYLVLAREGGGTHLFRLADDARPMRLAEQVGRVQLGGDRRIYYSRADSAGLLVLGRDGAADVVPNADAVDSHFAWRIVGNTLWYFASKDDDRIVLFRRGLDDGATTAVWEPREDIDHLHLSLSADARRVVVTTSGRNDTDIGLLRILRADAR